MNDDVDNDIHDNDDKYDDNHTDYKYDDNKNNLEDYG
jgi:hypothetical protein